MTSSPAGVREGTTTIIGALFVVAFALRLAFGLEYWVGKPLMKDEQEYLLLATRIVTGHGFNYPVPSPSAPPVRHFERPPAFAAFVGAVLMLSRDPLVGRGATGETVPDSSSDVPVSIKVAQSLVGALGVVLIAALARRAGGARAAVAAAAVAAVYPPLAWSCGYVISEPLYSALALTAAWLLQRASDEHNRHPAASGLLAGIVAGAALLTKEAMLFFLPLAFLWLVLKRRRVVAFALAAGVAVVALPWVGRNYVVHDRFILTAAHGGVTLWTGNNPLADGEGDLAANPEMGMARVALEDSHPGLTNQELDSIYYREVFSFVRTHPFEWIALEAKKLFYTFAPIGPSYRLHSTRYFAATVISYGLLVPFALAGLWSLYVRHSLSRLWAVWLLAASTVIVSLVFFPQERFRIPVMDPAGIIAASAWWGLRRPR